MATYYLIRGDNLIASITSNSGGVIAMPLLGGGDPMSLMSKAHADNLMANMDLTKAEALAALGVADLESGAQKALFIGPNPVSVDGFAGSAYHLVNVGTRSLWQVNAQPSDLLALHNAFYALNPASTLGLLAIVQEFNVSFYPAAVRALTGMTSVAALARRDRIAILLEGLSFEDTDDLRAATNEHDQMLGFVMAINKTAVQLWTAMVE